MNLKRKAKKILFKSKLFTLEEVDYYSEGLKKDIARYRLLFSDWTNIACVTNDQKVVLVKQFRAGLEEVTIENPGGACKEGEDYKEAVRRELKEETGYQCEEVVLLKKISTNPALMNNYMYCCLGLNAKKVGDQQLEGSEEIEILEVPIEEARNLLSKGKIHHAYTSLTLILALEYLNLNVEAMDKN